MHEVHLAQGPVQLLDHVQPVGPGDRLVGVQPVLGLGDQVAQADRVLGVFGLAAVGRQQDGDGRVAPVTAQLGEDGGREIGCVHRVPFLSGLTLV